MGQESVHTPTHERTQGQRAGQHSGAGGSMHSEEERERERHQSKAEAPEITEAGREGRGEEEEESMEGRSRQVMGKARHAGERVASAADSAMTSAGERVERLGHALSERAPSGRAGRVISRTGEAIERSGEYLQESSPTDVRRDVGNIMSRRPITTLLMGMGIGYLIARALRRS